MTVVFDTYVPGSSLLHRLDPRVKLWVVILSLVLAFLYLVQLQRWASSLPSTRFCFYLASPGARSFVFGAIWACSYC
jgi:energy-coupling factor transporter transmembrane protein EcfT